MSKMKTFKQLAMIILLLSLSCKSKQNKSLKQDNLPAGKIVKNTAKGNLFIIGGGKISKSLIKELISTSNLKDNDFIVILPMASEEPDSASYYAKKSFVDVGINADKIKTFNLKKEQQSIYQIDSIKRASLVYITGGDQNLFMSQILHTPAYQAIHTAYQNGATIAGTSAGAAVMSREMITGIEYKHSQYTGNFRTIESENFEIKEGLGLMPSAIIDQHFIYRMRMNRLLSVVLEHPDKKAIGINESTALIVHGDSAVVSGESQVIILKNSNKNSIKTKDGLLGGENILIDILLPGEKFKL
jgi:cyanophycinase